MITACFFLSGLAGLIYEVVWARQLSLFLGITSYAHTAVITAYMAGLAAGSLYFGRHADRHPQPLKIYAWLEIGVGVYAAITPWLFSFLQSSYISVTTVSQIGQMSGHLTRFSIALLALLVPTFLMGGTLPLLVRGFVTELPGLGKVTGRFYGINTLGAMLGTLLAGYLLLPEIGVRASIFVGVVINLAIAIIVLIMLHRFPRTHTSIESAAVTEQETQAAKDSAMSPRLRFILLAGFGTAGFAALLTQLAWIRALILVVGGSVYAFTITLASFLAGIGLGSLLYTRYLANPGDWLAKSWLQGRMVQATLLTVLIGLTLLLGLPLIGMLPGWLLAGFAAGLQDNFRLFQLFIFVLSFGLMILPTLFMGILFPLVTVIWTHSVGRAGRGVGAAYAINTTGTIFGALIGGLFILPWLGVHYSIMLAAGLYLLVAIAFWLHSSVDIQKMPQRAITVVTVLVFLLIAWSIPPWNKALMVSGVFVTPEILLKQMRGKSLQQVADLRELLYYKEGLHGVVAVRLYRNNKALVINGKTDASSVHDLPTQVIFAQLPLALDRKPESALLIGLGSGITAGSLATNELIKSLTILEISDEVVEASAFFEAENYGVLNNPKVELITADARNFLMASSHSYDLIISEPSNPWITGVSNLFTDEFFKLAKSRLKPGGVMTQWIHTYGMSNTDLKTVLKTFDENFRYVSVWSPLFEDFVIMGSDQPYAISLDHARGVGAQERAGELRRGNVKSDRDLVRLYLFGGELLSSYISGSEINSDDKPVIEFNAPRNLYTSTTRQNMTNIIEYLGGRKEPVPVAGMVNQSTQYLDARFMDLKIYRHDGLVPNDIRSQWLVSQLLPEERGVRNSDMTGSERVMSWKEGPAMFRIQANWIPSALSKEELPGLLNKWTSGTGRRGGIIQRADDFDAIWLVRGSEGSSRFQLDIVWACRYRNSGFTHYSLHVRFPDPVMDMQDGTLDSLMSRFHCYTAGQ
ncbi:MAG: fused MFS/spermidine synthase [Proteobacteria bacterium]|nr:fused MFS/spermidine synthase [Pseudomonadota bacterium]